MAKGSPHALSSVVGSFPHGIAQELAQPFEARGVNALLDPTQRREATILRVRLPGRIALLSAYHVPSFSPLVPPDSVPIGEEAVRNLQIGPDRAGEERLEASLLVGIEMLGTTHQEEAVVTQVK